MSQVDTEVAQMLLFMPPEKSKIPSIRPQSNLDRVQ